jgi:cytochrome c-type biogenesis protein
VLSGDLAFAAAAGTLAAVNPCGFAMLPAYLVLFAAAEDGRDPSPAAALGRALASAAAMTAGFVAVFGTFGLLLTPVAGSVQRWAPVVTVVVGAALAVLGVLMLTGRKVALRVPGLRVPGLAAAPASVGGRTRALLLYGVSYAVTSLGCAIGPFLAVVATTLRSGDLVQGLAAYAVYALGMGAVVALLAVTTALTRRSTARPLRRLAPYAAPVGGALLVGVGAYVAWFGAYELRVRAGADPDDPVIARAGSLQGALSRWIDAVGPTMIALVLAAPAAVVLATGARHRRRASR